MPLADPTSACVGRGSGDGKIACETLSTRDELGGHGNDDDPDAPPESFWLSKDAEFDWFDRNAYFERKDSGKGGTGPNSTTPNHSINNSMNSQRMSSSSVPSNFKSKASIIGFPKTPKPSFAIDQKNRKNCRGRTGSVCLFPNKLTASVCRQGADVASSVEPASPKVSCMGRVRSKKGSHFRARESSDHDQHAKRKSRFLWGFQALFRFGCRGSRAVAVHAPVAESPVPARRSSVEVTVTVHDVRDRTDDSASPRRSSVDGEQPGLAGMMKFASGRRSGSWPSGGSELEP